MWRVETLDEHSQGELEEPLVQLPSEVLHFDQPRTIPCGAIAHDERIHEPVENVEAGHVSHHRLGAVTGKSP